MKVGIFLTTLSLLFIVAGCHPEQRLIQQRRTAIDFYGEAIKLEERGEYQQAIELLLKAVELSPRPAIYYHLGHCYNMLGEKARAAQFLRRALQEAPDYKQAELELAEVEFSLRDIKPSETPVIETAETFTSVVSKKQDSPPAFSSLETSKSLLNETPASSSARNEVEVAEMPLPAVNKDLKVETTPVPPRSEETKIKTQPLASATTTTVTPISDEIRQALFPRLYGGKNTDVNKELGNYLKGRSLIDNPLEYHYYKGMYYTERKLWREAITEFQSALRVDKNHLDSILALAEAYTGANQLDKAELTFQRALQLAKEEPLVLFKSANFYLRQKNYDRAIELYNMLKAIQPDNPKVYNNLGIAWLRKNNLPGAEENFKLAISKDKNFDTGYYNLGILYDSYLNKPQLAGEMYRAYIALNGKNKEQVQHWLNELELKLNKGGTK
ncbi:MAG: tetratricopeptide repeat protein [Candidatus Sumerlaeia bacterium]|nr:tetratricopeptide repeat protein [Candidatus Sumerlaeia bacterium]